MLMTVSLCILKNLPKECNQSGYFRLLDGSAQLAYHIHFVMPILAEHRGDFEPNVTILNLMLMHFTDYSPQSLLC